MTPGKQAYLDRCKKRSVILAKKQRQPEPAKVYIPPVKGTAPFAYMVERGPKKSELAVVESDQTDASGIQDMS